MSNPIWKMNIWTKIYSFIKEYRSLRHGGYRIFLKRNPLNREMQTFFLHWNKVLNFRFEELFGFMLCILYNISDTHFFNLLYLTDSLFLNLPFYSSVQVLNVNVPRIKYLFEDIYFNKYVSFEGWKLNINS